MLKTETYFSTLLVLMLVLAIEVPAIEHEQE